MAERDHHLEEQDPAYHTGTVEDGKDDDIDEQILPVWATTEPFGYEGSPADMQAVGGEPIPPHVSKDKQRRDVIGPGSA